MLNMTRSIGNKSKKIKSYKKSILTNRKLKKKNRTKAKFDHGGKKEKGIPRTIERLTEFEGKLVDFNDVEIKEENDVDEFSDYFSGKAMPKIMITTTKRPSKKMYDLLKEMIITMPHSYYYKKSHYGLKALIMLAKKNEFTDILAFDQHRKVPSGIYICHLPNGPTSYFAISSIKLAQDMRGSAALDASMPEIILNNFNTQLGYRVARQFASLFPQNPDFKGRRVITLHNQRDFIFFRQHRYIFRSAEKCCLQEIGPRFTLKLRWIQEGTLNLKDSNYEYIWRPDLQVDRKRMYI